MNRRLRQAQYRHGGYFVVLEGVATDDSVSLVGGWGDDSTLLEQYPEFHPMVSVPSDLSHGIDADDWRIDVGSQTATWRASDDLVRYIERAKRKWRYGEEAVWEMPPALAWSQISARPGRYRYAIQANTPPFDLFHSETTTYRVVGGVDGDFTLETSLPVDDKLDVVVWQGYPTLEGQRMLVVEADAGEMSVDWRGFLEDASHSAAQTEYEVSAVDWQRPARTPTADRRKMSVTVERRSSLRYGGSYELLDADHLPEANPPGHISVDADGTIIAVGEQLETTVSVGGAAELGTHPDDEEIDVARADVLYTGDRDGILGDEHGPGYDGVSLLRAWLEYFLASTRTNDDGHVVTDGATWDDLIDRDEFERESDHARWLDHYSVRSRDTIEQLAARALVPTRHFLRQTADGRIGVSRIRSMRPDDLEDVFSLTSAPSQRFEILSERLDEQDRIRKKHATYVADLGGIEDVDPDEVEARPPRAVNDPAPRYLGAEKRLDFRFFHRGRRGWARDMLTDLFHALRIHPVVTVVVRQRDFSDWGIDSRDDADPTPSKLPPVGEWVRIDGGLETGVIGPDGERIDLEERDLVPVGQLLHVTKRRSDRTAEIKLLMLNWGRDTLPRVVAPAVEVEAYVATEPDTLDVRFFDEPFISGDQVTLYDRTGRRITSSVYDVDEVDGDQIRLTDELSGADQNRIDAWADSRGVTLRLADLSEYSNVWSPPLEDYFLDPANATRKWAYWDADPADQWRL